MLSGKRFRLERGTLSIETKNDKPVAVTIPAGSIVTVVSGPTDGNGLVNVVWESRKLQMFAIDMNVRGTEITDRGARA